ncbi:MAG: hypothetical protein LBC74_01310, partial [Planctomycetaceae bacterium]|nr:hypothetical protein [Planctomycetaceae bacterium]
PKNTSTQQKNYNKKPPLTPPRPPLTPPKEGNKKMPPKVGNYSPPSEGSGVVSYRLAKRSSLKSFENKNLKHQQGIKRRATTLRVTMLSTKGANRRGKKRPIDQLVQTNKEIVQRVNFIKLMFNIKKRGIRIKFGYEK